MAIVNANDVTLLIETSGTAPAANAANTTLEAIGHATSVSLDISRENILLRTKALNGTPSRIPAAKDWSGSGEGYTDYDTTDTGATLLTTTMNAGTKIYIRFGQDDMRFVGGGYLTSVSQTAGTDEAPTYSFSFEGDGDIAYDDDVTV